MVEELNHNNNIEENKDEQKPIPEEVIETEPVKYTLDANGFVSSFGNMTKEEIKETFIGRFPQGARGFALDVDSMYKWSEALRYNQEEKRRQIKEETGKELTKSERLGQVWGGLKKVIGAPIVAALGVATVLGAGHGIAHGASQGTIGFKKIWSGITGKHFNEGDDSKWYNKIANEGF